MKRFTDILPTLENAEHIQRIDLFNPDGSRAGKIENKPGSAGSVRVYHHLWKKHGAITVEAAKEGLKIYAEHTEDAENNPDKHPNIDRLFSIIESSKPLTVEITKQE
ncbi:MAG: DUF2322 domain-containing protein [Betaproteobacteria bacterium HGW-Betaproteobacteria-8]|nr:MAG: DUF2322 domain-containing protein [Betaproteobacteria bacterium HGW-Betaproteobacteria-8]